VANTLTGIFETLVVPAGVQAAAALKFTKATIGCAFWDYQSTHGTIGQTMNVDIPVVNEGDVVDIGSGPLQPSDTDHTTVSIVLQNHPSVSFVIKDWDKIRTPIQLQTLYMQPKLEALLRYCNRVFTSQINPTNFNVYPQFASTSTNEFNRIDLAGMWSNLADEGVPVYDSANMFMLTNPTVYSTMFSDTSFYQQFVVGTTAAEQAQQKALLVPQLNAVVKFDQQIGKDVNSKQIGLFFHRYAMAGICVTPPSNANVGPINETYLHPVGESPNFTVQLQMQYDIMQQGTVINLHAMFGTKVVRPEYGVYGHTL
jgi:hypothetical protein